MLDNQLDASADKEKNLKTSFSRARTSMREKRSSPSFVSAERFKELEEVYEETAAKLEQEQKTLTTLQWQNNKLELA